jgi:hypothetical protein
MRVARFIRSVETCPMEAMIAGMIVSGGLLVIGVVAVVRAWRRRPLHSVRDELLRAGESAPIDQRDAGNRAVGSNAWMRPDGGGF